MDGAFHSLQHIRCSQKFRSLSADLEMETLLTYYQESDYPLVAKFLPQCRGGKTKVVILGIMTLTSGIE